MRGTYMLAMACALAGCATTIPENLAQLPPDASQRPAGPDAVEVRYFGVSTLMFTSGGTSIMIDGFFSRPPLPKLLLGPLKPHERRIQAGLSAGDVYFKDDAATQGQTPAPGRLPLKRIFVSHSHFDHAMDVGVVARLTGARVSGSASTETIAREQGAQAQMDVHGDSAVLVDDVAPFTVRVFKVDHGPTPRPLRFEGPIDKPVGPLANMGSYRQGTNYAYWICHPAVSMLVVPSADAATTLPGAAKKAVDVVFLGIGRLGKQDADYIDAYWSNVVADSGASLVVPIHWDDFTRPLDSDLQPLPLLADDMAAAIGALKARAKHRAVDIQRLPLLQPVRLPTRPAPRDCSAAKRLDDPATLPPGHGMPKS